MDPSAIKAKEIIGGIDGETGKKTGLEAVADVFPKYRKVPSLLLAPKWSTDSTVAAVIEAKARKINGHFQAMGLVDLDTTKVKKYGDATKAKMIIIFLLLFGCIISKDCIGEPTISYLNTESSITSTISI